MILQALNKLLAKAEIKNYSPLDLVNWVELKVDLTVNGIYIGVGVALPRAGWLYDEAAKIVQGSKRIELFDYDIMDRFWQGGKLILVTKNFKVFDESTTRVYRSSCSVCSTPAADPAKLRWLRLVGKCLRCACLPGAESCNALWTAERAIVAGRCRFWYKPLPGLLGKL